MRDDGYKIEESDDPRTVSDELIPDCERPFAETTQEEKYLPVLEYLAEFKALIDACGQVSYYYNMKLGYNEGFRKVRNIASAYSHDLRYYVDQLAEWRMKAKRSLAVLKLHMRAFAFDEISDDSDFLNRLAVSKDRREAFKGYLETCLRTKSVLSPKQMEAKFQLRLQKRLKRAK